MPVHTQVAEVLRQSLPAADEDRALKFLEQGFSVPGQIAIASVFLYAREHSKQMDEVLEALSKEWKRNWYFQHPNIRGSADAPGGAGLQNRASLENIYSTLGIPSPTKDSRKK